MYCPNCKQEYDGRFCPECGTKLIEKPVTNDIPGINLGDANAISGGLNVNASKNIHNEDRSIHNITNTTSTVNNITQVAAQKTEMELLQERKTLYLNACKRAYEDNVLEQDEKFELDRYRMELGLDETSANQILEQVHMLVVRHAQKSELTGIAKIKLNQLTDALKKNEIAALMRQIDSIEVLAGKFSNDELHRKYYLVLAALKEDNCIEKYTSSMVDNYWQSFWGCLAYQKKGQTARAEEILFSLTDKFPNHPEDNMSLLAVACAYMRKDMAEASELLQAVSGDYTPGLQRFAESLYLLLDPDTAKEMGATEQGCAFYLVNFFGRNLAAEEEARRKAAEEDAKRKTAEEEAKRKAEECYMLVIDGQQAGPFEKEQLQELVQKDVLTGQTYVWKQGMANWEFAENVPEVKTLLKQQPDKSAYMLVLNGQQAGPYDMNQLQQLARDGVLTGDTYAWKQGMANWEFAENVKELHKFITEIKPEPSPQPEPKMKEKKSAAELLEEAKKFNELGEDYYYGRNGKRKDFKKAVTNYRKAAEQGYAEAQKNLAYMYDNGKGVEQSYTEAVKWYRKAAEQGYAAAQFNLANMYNNGKGVEQSYTEAVKWYRKAAEQGNAKAQNNLANMYYDGEGVEQSYTEAVKWYRKAAKQGNAKAQFNLAEMYYNGEGVKQSNTEAVKWYRKAAEQGDEDAQYHLGWCYYKGKGVSRDYAEAVKWLRKAAEQGDEYAQYHLGWCYYEGKGVSRDYAEAVKWLRKAAKQGSVESNVLLGIMKMEGKV